MRPHLTRACLLLTIASSGCERKVDRAPAAEVEASAPAVSSTDATPNQPPDGSLAIDASASEVAFVGAKVTAEHEGHFAHFDGWVAMDSETPTGLGIVVRTASVEIEPGMLTRHLKTDDFLAVDEHPTAEFRSTAIEAQPSTAEGEATHRVSGSLKLRGIENSVSFPARIIVEAGSVVGLAEFSIDRKQWGIEYRGMKDDLIDDQVVLKVRLKAPR